MTRPAYFVVGAGASGLGCALEFVGRADVTVIDRIPVCGGSAGWSSRTVRRLTEELTQRGVRFRLGQTALRWDGSQLTVAGPGQFDRLTGEQLFFAGGLRPATSADLRIDGDRPAGVLPATVAEHLLNARVKLWDRVVVLGDGPWARPVAAMSRRLGSTVIAVADHGVGADVTVAPALRYSVVGRQRVQALRLHRQTGIEEIACEAVILAGHPQPNRNIDGALHEGAAGVTFQQPVAPPGFEGRVAAARASARHWLTMSGAST